MESRKIQKVGTSTLTISLPRSWATARNLKKGDQVFLIEEGETLKVVPASSIQDRRRAAEEYVIDADLCEGPEMLEQIIVGCYVLGRERFTVKSSSRIKSDQVEVTRRASRRLMGLGIIEETSNRIVLQCSIEPTKYPIDALLKRLFNLGSTMLDEAVEALTTRDRRLAEDAMKREDDADMMYWLIVRLLLSAQLDDGLVEKLGMKSKLEIAGYRLIAKELESVADHGEEISQTVMALIDSEVEIPSVLVKALKDLSEGVRELYSRGIAALLSRDLKVASETVAMRNELAKREEKFTKLLFDQTDDNSIQMRFRTILHGIERMGEYATSIAVVAINRYLERPSNICHPASA